MKTIAILLTTFMSAFASAQQKPTTGYAPVNGLKMYYEIHGPPHSTTPTPGSPPPAHGVPVVLLHGAFMTITNNWTAAGGEGGGGGAEWIGELSKTRQVIAIEMQGHGRTADIERDISQANLADDVAALLDFLKIPKADLIGYSMGGGVAMQCAVSHPDKVRKVVVISSVYRHDGMNKEGSEAIATITPELFAGSTIEIEYKKLSPTPDDFPKFIRKMIATASKGQDMSADQLKATAAPMFFIFGDADGIRLEHVAEMFRLKGGGTHGDLGPRTESRLAILPDTTHVTLMQADRMTIIVPMVNDFLDAKPASASGPEGVSLTNEEVLKIARDAVAANDTWVGEAEFETPKPSADGSWSVLVWRLPKTPGGHRLILIDKQGNVTAYHRGA